MNHTPTWVYWITITPIIMLWLGAAYWYTRRSIRACMEACPTNSEECYYKPKYGVWATNELMDTNPRRAPEFVFFTAFICLFAVFLKPAALLMKVVVVAVARLAWIPLRIVYNHLLGK